MPSPGPIARPLRGLMMISIGCVPACRQLPRCSKCLLRSPFAGFTPFSREVSRRIIYPESREIFALTPSRTLGVVYAKFAGHVSFGREPQEQECAHPPKRTPSGTSHLLARRPRG